MTINILIIEFGIRNLSQIQAYLTAKKIENMNIYYASSFLDVVDRIYLDKINIIVFSNFRGVNATVGYIKMFKKTDSEFRILIIDNEKTPVKENNTTLIQYGASKVIPHYDLEQINNSLSLLSDEIFANSETRNWRELTIKFIGFLRLNYYSQNAIAEDLSRSTGYSKSSIYHYIKEDTGKTFNTWLTEFRIKGAMQLLKSTNLSVKEISKKVGYKTQQGLIKAFRKHEQHSPGYFRPSEKNYHNRKEEDSQ